MMEAPRLVVVDTGGAEGSWAQDIVDWIHEMFMPSTDHGPGFSFNRVLETVQRENNFWDGVKAGSRVAGEELLAHTASALDTTNDFHSGVVDATSFGITKVIREQAVPGITNYESNAYGVGVIQGTVASTALGAAQVARGIAAAWGAYNAAKAAKAVAVTSQVAKSAGGGVPGAATSANTAAIAAGARAKQIHETVGVATQGRTTIAVTERVSHREATWNASHRAFADG